jgi:hypothetical protein
MSNAATGRSNMRKLVVSEFVTLDGVMEAPGGEASHPHTAWTIPYGVPALVHELLAHGLVDELRLMVFPVVIGGGLRVFAEDRAKIALELTELVRYDSGVLLQIYRPALQGGDDSAGQVRLEAALAICHSPAPSVA